MQHNIYKRLNVCNQSRGRFWNDFRIKYWGLFCFVCVKQHPNLQVQESFLVLGGHLNVAHLPNDTTNIVLVFSGLASKEHHHFKSVWLWLQSYWNMYNFTIQFNHVKIMIKYLFRGTYFTFIKELNDILNFLIVKISHTSQEVSLFQFESQNYIFWLMVQKDQC